LIENHLPELRLLERLVARTYIW